MDQQTLKGSAEARLAESESASAIDIFLRKENDMNNLQGLDYTDDMGALWRLGQSISRAFIPPCNLEVANQIEIGHADRRSKALGPVIAIAIGTLALYL